MIRKTADPRMTRGEKEEPNPRQAFGPIVTDLGIEPMPVGVELLRRDSPRSSTGRPCLRKSEIALKRAASESGHATCS